MAGVLALKINLNGKLQQWRDLTGEGALAITDGHLWHWNILRGMANALLIPEFKNFVFTAASADFTLHDRKVFSHNARMTSKSVTLEGQGSIDSQKNLDFDIKPTFSQIAILQSQSLKKKATSVVTQTPGYLNIKLTGTTAKPHFKVEKSPLKIIKGTIHETTATIKEVIGGIVGEIF